MEREGTTAIVRKYRNLVRTLKQTRVEQVILSGILPVIGRRGHRYRNCRGMAINMLVENVHEGQASSKWKGGSNISGWTLGSSRQCMGSI